MSNNVDPEAIRKALVADLGRARQDNLPLSDRELRGPSYAPVGKNGTGHFAARFKEGLRTKWSVEIRDEESEQVEGLANEDARPWAKKIAKDFMAHNTAASAPPRVAQVARAQPVGRLGGLIPPGVSSVVKTSSRDPKASAVQGLRVNVQKPTPSPSAMTQAAKLSEPKEQPSRAAVHQTEPDKSPSDGEYVLSQGACDVRPALGAADFKATFAIRFDLKANRASLVLTAPGKGQKVHNVLDLNAPVMEGPYCVTATRLGSFVYRLKLDDAASTEKFKDYLDNLQVAAGREESPPPTTMAAEKEPASEKPRQPGRVQSQDASPASKVAPSAGSTRLVPLNGAPTETGQASTKPPTSQATPTLIDVADTPPTKDVRLNAGDVRDFTIEDAAEHLYQLVQSIIPEITGQGLRLSEDAINDIEDVAIEYWLNRGFLETEADDMKAELLELLRLLARIKRKTELQRNAKANKAVPLSPSMEALRGLKIGKAPPKRIQYTASEIESLEDKATPRPRGLESVGFLLKLASQKAKAKWTVEARMPQLSLCREWLNGSTNEEKTPSSVPQDVLLQSNGSAASGTTVQTAVWGAPQNGPAEAYEGDIMQIGEQGKATKAKFKADESNHVDSPRPAAAVPAKPGPSKGTFQGLSSSRWAQ